MKKQKPQLTPEQKRLYRIFLLTNAFIKDTDEIIDNSTDEVKDIVGSLKIAQGKMIPFLDEIFSDKNVSSSIMFNPLLDKLDYILEQLVKRGK